MTAKTDVAIGDSDFTDLTGLLVTTTRIAVNPRPRARVIGLDQLFYGLTCRCGCGPSWALEFEDPSLNIPGGPPFGAFAHDLELATPLEQLARLPDASSCSHHARAEASYLRRICDRR